MTSLPHTPLAPLFLDDARLHRRKIAEAANNALAGKIKCTASLTLNSSTTTTTLTDPRLQAYSFVAAMPLTASAATAHSGLYYTALLNGQLTVNHASSTATDQKFTFVILGG